MKYLPKSYKSHYEILSRSAEVTSLKLLSTHKDNVIWYNVEETFNLVISAESVNINVVKTKQHILLRDKYRISKSKHWKKKKNI